MFGKCIVVTAFAVVFCVFAPSQVDAVPLATTRVEDASYWQELGINKLKQILSKTPKNRDDLKAKNIIIFVGDGMGMTTITAGRIFKGQQAGETGEEGSLIFEDFPHTGLAKTYNVDKQVPDSAGTATAMFSGVKTLYGVVGLDATRSRRDRKQGRVPSIMDWAQAEGKRTGIVTTTRITHATPAATYAGIYNRDWECDTEVPADVKELHVDIARQLVEENPGRRLNVVMGGGLKPMGNENLAEVRTVNFTGDTETICARGDGRNLTDEWLKLDSADTRRFIQTRDQLMTLNMSDVDYVLGLFRNNHITYKIAAEEGEPRLFEMVEQAIKVLDRPESPGYVLMVEGGRIDQAHHQNYARAALHEVLELDKAVDSALRMTSVDETLIIVTSDHSHSLTFNGYPMRGNDILGFANKTATVTPYETLTYANGPGYTYHRLNSTDLAAISSEATWIPVHELGVERLQPTYPHLATFELKDESHGGEDVAVFASGPGSSLFRGTFEQNYVAFVMSYAGCMGPAKDVDDLCDPQPIPLETSGKAPRHSWRGLVFVVVFILVEMC